MHNRKNGHNDKTMRNDEYEYQLVMSCVYTFFIALKINFFTLYFSFTYLANSRERRKDRE
jgi:hypothetical protein